MGKITRSALFASIHLTLLTACGGGDTDSNTPTIPAATTNSPPSLASIAPQTTFSKAIKVILLVATDPDGDVLTYTATSSEQAITLALDATNLTLIPDDNFYGMANITVTVSDGTLSDSSTFAFKVAQASAPPIPEYDINKLSTPPSIGSL